MKILVHVRNNGSIWGGDMAAINSLCNGLRLAGAEVLLSPNIQDALACDLAIITNTCLDQRSVSQYLVVNGIPYAVLPFQEDFIKYFQASISFAMTAEVLLKDGFINDQKITLEYWGKFPHLISFNACKIPNSNIISRMVLEQAVCVMPSSNFELNTVVRDSPNANVHVIKFPAGLTENFSGKKTDVFNEFISSNESYILQVGRLEVRKNQIATVLATADIPKTLVLVSTKSHNKNYSELLFKLIKKYRKYRTVVVSQEYDSVVDGVLEIIKMPDGEKLSYEMLESAYRNAAINLHPAFHELPGYTYLESVHCGIETIISDWTSVREYLVAEDDADIASVNPCNILDIKNSVIDGVYGKKFSSSKIKVDSISVEQYGVAVMNCLLKSMR